MFVENCDIRYTDLIRIWLIKDGEIDYLLPWNARKSNISLLDMRLTDLPAFLRRKHFSSVGDEYGFGIIEFDAGGASLVSTTNKDTVGVYESCTVTIPVVGTQSIDGDFFDYDFRHDIIAQREDGSYLLIRSTFSPYTLDRKKSISSSKFYSFFVRFIY